MDNYKLRIHHAIDTYMNLMFKNDNIVGFGRGNKIINGKMTNIPTLTIFVRKKINKDMLDKRKLIPQYIHGSLVDIIEDNNFVLTHNPISNNNTVNKILPYGKRALAYAGDSVSNANSSSYGTITYAVTDIATKKNLWLLSCAHVLCNEQFSGSKTEKIMQPGIANGGNPTRDIIGYLDKYYVLMPGSKYLNTMDAALAFIGENNKEKQSTILSPKLRDGTIVNKTITVEPGNTLRKFGAKTNLTSGKVLTVYTTRSFNSTRTINDKDYTITLQYKDQITTTLPSMPGDSGSLVTNLKNIAVGMLIGGGETGATLTPINTIFSEFKIEFAAPL